MEKSWNCVLNFCGNPDIYKCTCTTRLLSSMDLDVLSGLIWMQTICRGYQQMTLAEAIFLGIHWKRLGEISMAVHVWSFFL